MRNPMTVCAGGNRSKTIDGVYSMGSVGDKQPYHVACCPSHHGRILADCRNLARHALHLPQVYTTSPYRSSFGVIPTAHQLEPTRRMLYSPSSSIVVFNSSRYD